MKSIQTPLIITSIRSRKDGSLGFSAETPEYTTEEKVAFMELQNKNVTCILTPDDYKTEEELKVDTEIDTKTQSQRIRSVLYVLWKELGEEGLFRDFYEKETEKFIIHIKGRLE